MPSNQSVLVLGELVFMRRVLKGLLRSEGFKVYEAGNLHQAMDSYHAFRPDVVIVGTLNDGLASVLAIEAIRGYDPMARIVMVADENLATRTLVIEAVRAGASDFVVRPFRTDRLLTAVLGHPPDKGPAVELLPSAAADPPPEEPVVEEAPPPDDAGLLLAAEAMPDLKVSFLPSELDLIAF